MFVRIRKKKVGACFASPIHKESKDFSRIPVLADLVFMPLPEPCLMAVREGE